MEPDSSSPHSQVPPQYIVTPNETVLEDELSTDNVVWKCNVNLFRKVKLFLPFF
jgi:hypothetical protein